MSRTTTAGWTLILICVVAFVGGSALFANADAPSTGDAAVLQLPGSAPVQPRPVALLASGPGRGASLDGVAHLEEVTITLDVYVDTFIAQNVDEPLDGLEYVEVGPHPERGWQAALFWFELPGFAAGGARTSQETSVVRARFSAHVLACVLCEDLSPAEFRELLASCLGDCVWGNSFDFIGQDAVSTEFVGPAHVCTSVSWDATQLVQSAMSPGAVGGSTLLGMALVAPNRITLSAAESGDGAKLHVVLQMPVSETATPTVEPTPAPTDTETPVPLPTNTPQLTPPVTREFYLPLVLKG